MRRIVLILGGFLGVALALPHVAAASGEQPPIASDRQVSIEPAPEHAGAGVTVPNPPGRDASQADWEKWAAMQREATLRTDWKTILSDDACSTLSVEVGPADTGAWIPYGVETYAVSGVMKCNDPAAQPKIARSGAQIGSATTLLPDLTSSIPIGSQCASVTAGIQCVNPTTVNGNPNYRATSYKYTGAGSTFGHVMLSTLGSLATSCYPGTALRNGPDVTLYNGYIQFATYGPVAYSNVWEGNFWKRNGSNYSNQGAVCAVI
jgi:hypothetical protein